MDFEIPSSLAELQLKTRSFVSEHMYPLEAAYLQRGKVDSKSLQAKLKDANLWAVSAPSALGGIGLGLFAKVLVEEEIGKCVVPSSAGNDPATFFLTLCDATQQKAYLEPALAGRHAICLALSEAGAGSDLDSIKTTISKPAQQVILDEVGESEAGGMQAVTAQEESLEINGSKHMVVGLEQADQVIVVGKKGTEPGAPLVACLVDKRSPGVTVGQGVELFDGRVAYQLTFDKCAVPAASALGPATGVRALVDKTLSHWNACLAARAIGMAKRAIEMGSAVSSKKVTFGEKLSNNEAIQFKIADSATLIVCAQYALYAAAALMDSGQDASKEIGAAKVFATHAATKAIDESIQIHGASGLTNQLPLTALYRRARQFQLEAVPTEVLKRGIVLGMLKGNYLLGSVIS